MPELIAGAEYRDPAPPGSDRVAVQADAPVLLPILDKQSELHIYTKSNSAFVQISKVRAERTDMEALAVIRPLNEGEVADTVTHCAALAIPLAIRSGGNDIAERSRSHGGVVIDVRSLDWIVLSADRRSVRIGGGVTLGSLLRFLDLNGLDTPGGWGHEVGYVAWACGGGYGIECGAKGLGVDQILGGRIVTASGEVLGVQAGTNEHEDAWWALRGGGAGIIGVVTELTIKVYPKPKALAGYVWFSYGEAEKVFGNMQKLYEENFPHNFAGEVFLVNPLNDGGVINHFFWWELEEDGSDLEDAKAYHRRITECGTVILDTVKDKDGKYNDSKDAKPARPASDIILMFQQRHRTISCIQS